MPAINPETLVNTAAYPLLEPATEAYDVVITDAHSGLQDQGLVSLPEFLSARGLEILVSEALRMAPKAFHSEKDSNAYGLTSTKGLAADHPARIYGHTNRFGVGHHDMLGTAMDSLYTWKPIRDFIADIVELPELYLHEDPSNALVLQIYRPGGGLAWHFDRAHFSAS